MENYGTLIQINIRLHEQYDELKIMSYICTNIALNIPYEKK